jgi:hypothetical protein
MELKRDDEGLTIKHGAASMIDLYVGARRRKGMNRKEIIFFDELGFGWIVDKAIIKKIHENTVNEEMIVQKTLAELLRSP